MVKSIIKRIIVGVGIALVLMLIKGSFIGNVYASEIYSIETANGANFASCSNGCGSLSATGQGDGLANYIKNKTGNLFLNVMIYSESDANSFIPTLTKVRITAHNETYNCFISGSGNGYQTNTLLNRYINSYSAICPMTFDSTGGIQEILIQTNGTGTGGISLYSPMTFVVDSNQEIINSITENSQHEIESQKVCKVYSKDNIKTDGKYLTNGGAESSSSNWGITGYIRLNNSSKIIVKSTQSVNGNTCFYDNDKGLISCTPNSGLSVDSAITIPNNSSFVRFSINKSTNTPQFQVCSNGNQSVVDSTNELNDTLNDNNLSSGTNESMNSIFTFGTQEDTFGPVADLLLLPLTLFRAFYSGFDGTCSTFNLGTLFGHQLTMPCINLRNLLGVQLYNFIDVACSLFLILNVVLMCIDIFDRITSFEDPFNDLYSPKHTYHGRHEGGGNYHG